MDHMKSKTAFILKENNSCTPKILFYGLKSSVCTMFSEQELIGGKICYKFQIDHSKKTLNGPVIYNVNNAVESIMKALEFRQYSIGRPVKHSVESAPPPSPALSPILSKAFALMPVPTPVPVSSFPVPVPVQLTDPPMNPSKPTDPPVVAFIDIPGTVQVDTFTYLVSGVKAAELIEKPGNTLIPIWNTQTLPPTLSSADPMTEALMAPPTPSPVVENYV